jgi:membrane protein DedA with SNARE-associated domain
MIPYLNALAQDPNHPLGLLLLFLSSMIEYLFPPFPGDTITLFGAVLITAYHWSFWLMMVVLTLGSVLGAAIDFYIGVWARKKSDQKAEEGKKLAGHLEKLAEKLHKYGEAYIVINRFLPGVRAFFFYAAGFSGLRFGRVMLYATLSAICWNLCIVAAGAMVGANFDKLQVLAQEYTLIMWILMGSLVLLWGIWALWKKHKGNE